MKILVTGGAGFIGSNVVDRYVREGHEVSVVDDLSSGSEDNLAQQKGPSAAFYRTDIRDGALREVFERERPEVVNHHAAQISIPDSVKDPVRDASINVLGLLNLLECSVKYGVRRFIFISSGGAIYGEMGMQPFTEEHIPVPTSPYAISKLVSERYLAFYRRQHGLEQVVLRYANIYGPRQIPQGEAGVVAIFMDQILKGEVPTINHYPEEPDGMTRDYCYVQDIVEANVLALSAPKAAGEAFNIGAGVQTRTGEIYREILSAMRAEGRAEDTRFDNPLKGPARGGDLKKTTLFIGKAEQLLGWTPRHSLRDGIARTLKWRLGR